MKKGNKDLAALYPPYDKVTRGDVIAGRLKGMKGKKKKLQKEWSVYNHLGLLIAESLNLIEAEEAKPISPKSKLPERRKGDGNKGRRKSDKKGDLPEGDQPTAARVASGMYRGK